VSLNHARLDTITGPGLATLWLCMSLAPTPSATRGDLILQPPFFTSSLFVDPFRADIERLIDLFVQEHAVHAARPFALFKRLWEEQGWTYMHLKIFDARTRHTYLAVACRLFVGVYFLYCMDALIKTGGH
jgi:hypothetical protein